MHDERKLHWLQEAEFQMRLLANETRFIMAVVSGDLVVSNRKKADIMADLERAGYDKMPPKKKVHYLQSLTLLVLVPEPGSNGILLSPIAAPLLTHWQFKLYTRL